VTGPCSGAGVGVAKPGFAALQFIGPAAIGGALAGLSGWAGAGVGAAIGAISYDLTTFCPDGPPAMPTFSAADIAALLAPIPNPARAAAAQKFDDFLGNLFWPLLCNCTSGASVVPAPAAYPSGGPQQVTNTAPVGAACATFSQSERNTSAQTFFAGFCSGNGLNVTTTRVTLVNTTFAGAGATVRADFIKEQHVAPNAFLALTSVTLAPGTTKVVYLPFDPSYPDIGTTIVGVSGSGTAQTDFTVDMFCNGALPGASPSPCCPPDPATQAALDRILELLTLVQRQAAPFAYVYGTNHTALSGSGELTVADLVGVSVEVTTNPGYTGLVVGDPDALFGVGYVTLGTADGWTATRNIDHAGTLLLPVSAGVFTKIGYSLNPGVIVSIRELVREP
jgi:hypothetical protein